MVLKTYVVYDSKGNVFSHPLCFGNRALFFRFIDYQMKKGCQWSEFPADFTFFEVGEYNDESGLYTNYEVKENLGLAINFVQSAADPKLAPPSREMASPRTNLSN